MTNPKEALEWYERKRVEARAMADRDCKSCKHHKADGCSRWDCEYEPVMSDLIKKSDAIKALYKYTFVSKNVIEQEINAIPSEDRPTGWIPVSERLPSVDGDAYLVTDYCTQINHRRTRIAYCYANKDGFWSNTPKGYEVVAWMPLPPAYQGE